MEILTSAEKIKKYLEKVRPSHIAVAYIGKGWKNYIHNNSLKEIIVSPTLGSNPYAIQEAIKELGIGNVHFLTNLHSKIYLGDKSFVMGSCNLSNNALFSDASGLHEVAIYSEDKEQLNELNGKFSYYKELAEGEFKSDIEKINKLESLIKAWKKIPNSLDFNNLAKRTVPKFNKYDLNAYNIKISWWDDELEEADYEKKKISKNIGEKFSVEDIAGGSVFLKGDEIEIGDWILSWKARHDGFANEGSKPTWIFVTHVIPNGVNVKDCEYSKLAIQRIGDGVPNVPFELDEAAITAFRKTLKDIKFEEFKTNDNWRLPSKKLHASFLEAWQRNMK